MALRRCIVQFAIHTCYLPIMGWAPHQKKCFPLLRETKGRGLPYKTLFDCFVTNTYFLPHLGRDLGLRTHFVHFLAPKGRGMCHKTLCGHFEVRTFSLFGYMRWSCFMIWLHNFPCYSFTGRTVYKRRCCLIINDLFPSRGINSWLSKKHHPGSTDALYPATWF